MQGGQGADELDLEDEFDQPFAIQTEHRPFQRPNAPLSQRTQPNNSTLAWTPVVEKQLAAPQPFPPAQVITHYIFNFIFGKHLYGTLLRNFCYLI